MYKNQLKGRYKNKNITSDIYNGLIWYNKLINNNINIKNNEPFLYLFITYLKSSIKNNFLKYMNRFYNYPPPPSFRINEIFKLLIFRIIELNNKISYLKTLFRIYCLIYTNYYTL